MFDSTFLNLLYGQSGGSGELQTLAGLLWGVDSNTGNGGTALGDDSVLPSYLDADTAAKKKLFRDRIDAEGSQQTDVFTTFDFLGNLNTSETSRVTLSQSIVDGLAKNERYVLKVETHAHLQGQFATSASTSVNIVDSDGNSLTSGAIAQTVTSHSETAQQVYYVPIPKGITYIEVVYSYVSGDIVILDRKQADIYNLNYDVVTDLVHRTDLTTAQKETIRTNLGAGAAGDVSGGITYASRRMWYVGGVFYGASDNTSLGLEVGDSTTMVILPQGTAMGGIYRVTRGDDSGNQQTFTSELYRRPLAHDVYVLVHAESLDVEFHLWDGTDLVQVYEEQSGIYWEWNVSEGDPRVSGNATFVPITHVNNVISFSGAGLAMNGSDSLASNIRSALEIKAGIGHFFGAYMRVSAETSNDDDRPTWSPFFTLGAVNVPEGNATRDDTGLGLSIIPTYHRNNGYGDVRVAYATASDGFVDGSASTHLWEAPSAHPITLANFEVMALVENNRLRVIVRYPSEGIGFYHQQVIDTDISDWIREGGRNFFTALQYNTRFTLNRLAFGTPDALLEHYSFAP